MFLPVFSLESMVLVVVAWAELLRLKFILKWINSHPTGTDALLIFHIFPVCRCSILVSLVPNMLIVVSVWWMVSRSLLARMLAGY